MVMCNFINTHTHILAPLDTRRRTQDGSGDGSGDGNNSSSGDGNWEEDEKGDENEDGIGGSGREAKKRRKTHKGSRHDRTLSFRTHRYLCREGVALSGTRQLRLQGPESVYVHRTVGVTGSKGREGANGVGGGNTDGNGVGGGNGDVSGDGDGKGAGTGRRTRAERNTRRKRRRERGRGGNGDGGEYPWMNTGWER